MKLSNIQSFSIYGLFGTTDVHIPFDQDIKILIGENGVGKTQVLNILYYTLTRNFAKLTKFKFSSLVLSFRIDLQIELNKRELKQGFSLKDDEMKITGEIEISFLPELLNFLEGDSLNKKSKKYSLTPNLKKCAKKIKAQLEGLEILYFPTFRRVEEDLHNLGYEEKRLKFNENDERLIHFGMSDVKKRFVAIEDKIDALLKEGFSKISSEILSQLVKGFSEIDKNILHKINEKDIEIILARVGSEISQEDKEKIRRIVLRKELAEDTQQLSLLFFLQKLIEIYEKQRPLDNAVKIFRDICNRYLINKKVFYDESAIKIFIQSEITGEAIPLSKLSSGEKQIISIFSKIYLSDDNQRFMVLFDEPELSLSMPWQKQLLPDIVNSNKCDFLLAVTHSPFIFDNELDQYAVGLNEYINIPEKAVS